MPLAAKILQVFVISGISLIIDRIKENIIYNKTNIIDAAHPPSSQPLDYFIGDMITEPRVQDRAWNPEKEWNVEYNYGRNYKHSEGQEWGSGHNTANVLKNQYQGEMEQIPKLAHTETWTPSNTDESWMYIREMSEPYDGQQPNMLQSNALKKQFQEKTDNEEKNWYNWSNKNVTWPNWIPLKKYHNEKYPTPWWNDDSQQTEKSPKVRKFTLDEVISKKKKPFWSGSIGWTGDLGSFGEVPLPPWLQKTF
ncbi:hypothetical protein X798_03963 [Onchocerca flexuosa]|uniref:Uncharacterized protein n=1 Tax=Onchocerca flexuosa TaxID=387005 RepID=A0A238BUT9_9BILA|nr:hypothetical protein X798_03963 [Onchocerca flexuosa]